MSSHKYYKAALIVAFVLSLGFLVRQTYQNTFGAGYRPVTNYDARITSFVTAAATSMNVNTTKDKAGNEITLSDISPSSTVYAYFTVEPGITGQEELVACSGKSTNVWSSCTRGLSYQGGAISSSSTLAKAHNAGSRIIMTNIGQFYSEFVSVSGNETIYGVKTFNSFPVTTSTTALPSSNNEFSTKLYVDNVGAGGFTASNVSSTLGLQAISTGVPNCPSAAACVGINASSTNSANGGFMNFASSTGRLFWDMPLFLAGSWSWGGTNTFSAIIGTSTVNNLQITGTPDTNSDAVNKLFVDNSVSYNNATGTAGMTIAVGNALYISTTGTLFLTDADASSTSYGFVGIARTAATVGNEVTYTKYGGIVDNLTGLSSGKIYYLSGTAGAIATTAGTIPVRVGMALSANRFQVSSPGFKARASGTDSSNFNSVITVSLGWVPSRVDLRCGTNQANGSVGHWALNSNGSSSTGAIGADDDAVPYTKFSTTAACFWEEGTTDYIAVVATTTNGFTISRTGAAATRDLQWVAELDSEMIYQ